MVNLVAIPGVYQINSDLTDEVLSVIKQQFFITEQISGQEFDARISVDSSYISQIKGSGARILVVRPASDQNDRSLVDMVFFFKNGLISVENCKWGSPSTTFPARAAYLSQFVYSLRKEYERCCPKCGRPNYYNHRCYI